MNIATHNQLADSFTAMTRQRTDGRDRALHTMLWFLNGHPAAGAPDLDHRFRTNILRNARRSEQ